MKYIIIHCLFTISFKLVGQSNQCKLQIGTYGSYLDISTYVELTLKEDSTFKFVNRGFTGISDVYHGRWLVKKRKLVLYDYEIKIRPSTFKRGWDCRKIRGETLLSKQGFTLQLQNQ
ncbi:MAG: hypothetical protein ACKO7P_02255 [Bacteroidota bacterium]